jgi:vacuolar-type H+-ATPase subunit D/Vma8
MTDDLSKYLLSGDGRSTLSPERMEMMGKEAAQLLVEKKRPLHDSIVKIAGRVPDINSEQVKRVVEFANTAAYLAIHERNKTAGAESSYPQFELADPQRVLSSLKIQAEPMKTTLHDVSYSAAPEKRKVSTVKREEALEELFLGEARERVKTAGLSFSYETGALQLMSAKEELNALKESLEHSGERFDLMLKEAQGEYYDLVKRYLLDEGSFADVMRCAMEVEEEQEKIASVMVPVIKQILIEKVATAEQLRGENADIEKVAHRIVDPTHPLVHVFGAVLSLQGEVEKVAAALEDVDLQIAKVTKAVKEEFFARN